MLFKLNIGTYSYTASQTFGVHRTQHHRPLGCTVHSITDLWGAPYTASQTAWCLWGAPCLSYAVKYIDLVPPVPPTGHSIKGPLTHRIQHQRTPYTPYTAPKDPLNTVYSTKGPLTQWHSAGVRAAHQEIRHCVSRETPQVKSACSSGFVSSSSSMSMRSMRLRSHDESQKVI